MKFFKNYENFVGVVNSLFIAVILFLILSMVCSYIGLYKNSEYDDYYAGYHQGVVDYISEPDPLTITEFKVISLEIMDANVGNQSEKINNLYKISLRPESNGTDIINVSIIRINDPALDPDLVVGSIMYCINGEEYVTASDKRVGMALPPIPPDYSGNSQAEPATSPW